MTLENGIQALKNLEYSYTKRIKQILDSEQEEKRKVIDRFAQIREGKKQSMRSLEKIKDKNVDIVPLNL